MLDRDKMIKKMMEPGYDWRAFEDCVLPALNDFQIQVLARVTATGTCTKAQAEELVVAARQFEIHRAREQRRAIE